MSLKVVWSPSALRQIARIFNYLAQFNPQAVVDMTDRILMKGQSLAELPMRGRLVPGSDLREVVATHPYVIRYRVQREVVRILRIRHSARRPTVR